MDNFALFNQQQMLNRPMASPGDTGAGGGHLKNMIEGGWIGAMLGLKEAPGLLQGTQGFFDKKMAVWGSPRNPGPLGRALQEIRETLFKGSGEMPSAPQDFGYHEGYGINFSQVDNTAGIAPAATPSVEGIGGPDLAPSPA